MTFYRPRQLLWNVSYTNMSESFHISIFTYGGDPDIFAELAYYPGDEDPPSIRVLRSTSLEAARIELRERLKSFGLGPHTVRKAAEDLLATSGQ